MTEQQKPRKVENLEIIDGKYQGSFVPYTCPQCGELCIDHEDKYKCPVVSCGCKCGVIYGFNSGFPSNCPNCNVKNRGKRVENAPELLKQMKKEGDND